MPDYKFLPLTYQKLFRTEQGLGEWKLINSFKGQEIVESYNHQPPEEIWHTEEVEEWGKLILYGYFRGSPRSNQHSLFHKKMSWDSTFKYSKFDITIYFAIYRFICLEALVFIYLFLSIHNLFLFILTFNVHELTVLSQNIIVMHIYVHLRTYIWWWCIYFKKGYICQIQRVINISAKP